MIEGIDKKTLWFIGVISALVIFLWVVLFYYFFSIASFFSKKLELSGLEKLIKEEKITDDVLNQFKAPDEKGEEVSGNILKQFRASDKKGKEVSEDILKQFKVPE